MMIKHRVFYSFYYDDDAWRTQIIRNIGVIEGNKPVSPNDWEKIKNTGDKSIEAWIDKQMEKCSCVIVLIGSHTSKRKYVKYEIEKALIEGKGLFGIYIHNLEDQNGKRSIKGDNPFDFSMLGMNGRLLSSFIRYYDPQLVGVSPENTYSYIAKYLTYWIENAINEAKARVA